MQIFATVLLAVCVLISAVSARPTLRLSSPSNTRAWDDCPPLTSFYTCLSNGFKGCCTVDPCDRTSCPDFTGLGNHTSIPDVQPECSPGQHEVHQPTMYTIFPAYPDLASANSSDISFSQAANGTSIRQQLAIFTGIPSSAKNCGLQWYHNATGNFTVDNSGLSDVFAVESPLPSSVTWNTIRAGLGKQIGQADFTFWPHVVGDPDHNVASGIECALNMIFRVGISGIAAGDVELQQNEEAGFYVKYEC